MSTLDDLQLDDRFVRSLPADPVQQPYRREVRRACYSRVHPTPVAAPELVAVSPQVASLLGLDPDRLDRDQLAAVFSGNSLLPGMVPYAACYGGHQFGSWAGQLGDGRAITLGEAVRGDQRLELQLKGAGPTPYSRGGDGRAVMRSSVREFLCSEAMHHLGIPTTRAFTLVSTGESVVRDMFYDGRPEAEPGAIVCRVAPSFLRLGSFEIFAARGDTETLQRLVDDTITEHFPHLLPASGPIGSDAVVRWVAEVCERTAILIAHWMRVGFVHGVMNTDNLSVLGLTLDYGPYGWLEGYDLGWTPNTSDATRRRYRFGHQPAVARWNLVRFASALVERVGATEPLEAALQRYDRAFEAAHHQAWADKLGLSLDPDDASLIDDLVELLQQTETDMTLFFRSLAQVPTAPDVDAHERLAPLAGAYYGEVPEAVERATLAWLERLCARVRRDARPAPERRAQMDAANPRYVLRNYLAQLAIEAAEQGDAAPLEALLQVLRHPYEDQPGAEAYAARRPEWARDRPGCSTLSCSS